jgi:hypothetical protein
MSPTAGQKFGPYEIIAHLGRGGMGEVYRARDTKLGREVALKVLPPAFAEDSERLTRFTREAQALAALSHVNIAAIYGLEETGGTSALVMELVEGQTLADRIRSGPIPVDEAMGIARQIAEALEAAHERGIIHRDLKPANIKITPEGKVKVLDFGLAKAMDAGSTAGGLPADSPTETVESTRAGVILGTAAYMSPEQARGKAVDKRADIWSFGVVFFEMLTGKVMFEGETAGEILAAVLRAEIELKNLPADTPANIRRLLNRCLQRDPKERLRDIGDARIEIGEELKGGVETTRPATALATIQTAGRRRMVPWVLAALSATLVVSLAVVYFREPPPQPLPVKFTLAPPEKASFGAIAVSPDGTRIAFTATDSRIRQLWLRPLASLAAQPLAGTENADYPFWSPDARFIGFFADGKLKRIEASGGPPQTICDAEDGRGGAWSRQGTILFTPKISTSIYQVQATGGESQPVTSLDLSRKETTHRWPSFLPDDRHFLYFAYSEQLENTGIYLASLDYRGAAFRPSRLIGTDVSGAYAAPPLAAPAHLSYILFLRERTLLAQAFDLRRLATVGDPSPIAKPVGTDSVFRSHFSISENGVLVYDSIGGDDKMKLLWFDRSGRQLSGAAGPAGSYRSLALSPDGKRVAADPIDPHSLASEIWLFELAAGASSRFTFRSRANDFYPVWSPDGSRIVFASMRDGPWNLYQRMASGTGEDELMLRTNTSRYPPTGPWTAGSFSTKSRIPRANGTFGCCRSLI